MLTFSMDVLFHSWDAQTSLPWHIAMPSGGGIHSIISRSTAASASSANGRQPTRPPTRAPGCVKDCSIKTNTASGVWADTAYRSAANEAFMEKHGFTSRVHRKKPKGRAMPEAIRRANNAKSKIRARVEHVFAAQKHRMDLFIRTIGIARATTKIGMANLVYNIKRLLCLRRRLAA